MAQVEKLILAIDQGTSSTKAVVFNERGKVVAKATAALNTNYSNNGFVEQDPEDIYRNVLAAVKECLEDLEAKGSALSGIVSVGVSNQRETFLLWDASGKPLCPAIVWQCKRSVAICANLRDRQMEETIRQKTGLVIDPYFSATKLIWLAQNNVDVKEAIMERRAFFGTIDTWLLYKLTNGACYATDFSNASRTMLFNLRTLDWDHALIEAFGLAGLQLPVIKPSCCFFGATTVNGLLPHAVSIDAMIGDSHAAAFGEKCFYPGMVKATMGTGCSILMNIGGEPTLSEKGMVTTVCWSMEGRVDYAYEGVIVSCGATIEWLKNEWSFFKESSETERMANAVPDADGVYLVPAFSGLGSPHWQMDRKASITGMRFSTTKEHVVRAALEAIGYQIKDVVTAMQEGSHIVVNGLKVNGGISGNRFVNQFLADLLDVPVVCGSITDVSALGAAMLAGLRSGVFNSLEELGKLNPQKNSYHPVKVETAAKLYQGWLMEIHQYRPDNRYQ